MLTTGIILCIPLAAALTLAVYVVKRMRGVHIFKGHGEEVPEIIDVESSAS